MSEGENEYVMEGRYKDIGMKTSDKPEEEVTEVWRGSSPKRQNIESGENKENPPERRRGRK
jgi:hypothetical protein